MIFTGDRFGENFVLFEAYYRHLTHDMESSQPIIDSIEAAIADKNDFLSHDNWTGIVCLSKLYNLHYHKDLFARDFWRRLHPRDVGFYLYMKYGFKPFLAPTILSMIYACYHRQITMGNLDTDGKLLAWLRLKHMDMPWLDNLLTRIILKRHGATWGDIFKIYFIHESNPIVLLSTFEYGRNLWK